MFPRLAPQQNTGMELCLDQTRFSHQPLDGDNVWRFDTPETIAPFSGFEGNCQYIALLRKPVSVWPQLDVLLNILYNTLFIVSGPSSTQRTAHSSYGVVHVQCTQTTGLRRRLPMVGAVHQLIGNIVLAYILILCEPQFCSGPAD